MNKSEIALQLALKAIDDPVTKTVLSAQLKDGKTLELWGKVISDLYNCIYKNLAD